MWRVYVRMTLTMMTHQSQGSVNIKLYIRLGHNALSSRVSACATRFLELLVLLRMYLDGTRALSSRTTLRSIRHALDLCVACVRAPSRESYCVYVSRRQVVCTLKLYGAPSRLETYKYIYVTISSYMCTVG